MERINNRATCSAFRLSRIFHTSHRNSSSSYFPQLSSQVLIIVLMNKKNMMTRNEMMRLMLQLE